MLEDIENNNKIEKLYGNIYELLIKEIKEIYEISGHNCDIIFDSLNANKEKIARALKVVDGESITALVDKVEIYDNFSNKGLSNDLARLSTSTAWRCNLAFSSVSKRI